MPKKTSNKGTSKGTSKGSSTAYTKIDDTEVKVDDVVFKITNAKHFTESDTIVFSLEFADINFYDLKIVNGEDGKFISFPAREGKDGKWYKHYFIPFSDEEKTALIDALTS